MQEEVKPDGNRKVELTYDYSVENRLKAVHDKNDLLVAMAYDGDGNRIFQLNYNLHTDDDWKGKSCNGNGNIKDNSSSGNKGNTSGNGTGTKDQKGFLESIAGFFGGDEELVTETSEEEITLYSSNKDKDKGNKGNDKNNGKGNGNGNSLMELNINGIMDTAYSYGNERLTNERFTERTGYYTYDPRGSVTGVTDSKGIFGLYRYNANGDLTFGKPQYNYVYSYNAESYNPSMESQYLRARYYNVPNGNYMSSFHKCNHLDFPFS